MVKSIGFAIKLTTSRGRDTYGYTVCTIVGGGMKGRCMGGGYDMLGTSLAQITMQMFPEYFDGTIKYTPEKVKEYYGLRVYADGTAYFDGACGWECVVRFIEGMIGATVEWEYNRDRKGRVHQRIGLEITQNVAVVA